MNRLRFGEHVLRVQHALDRPAQVHGRRPGFANARDGGFEFLVVGDLRAQHGNAVGAEHTDARRAAHGQRFYGLFEFFGRGGAPDNGFMRQQTLIDILDRVPGPANGLRFDRYGVAAGACAV
jgi:hypothetical protein